jgi:hypothetical protein
MVVFDCGQKRLRFVHFRDDPAKYDGPPRQFRHIRGKLIIRKYSARDDGQLSGAVTGVTSDRPCW